MYKYCCRAALAALLLWPGMAAAAPVGSAYELFYSESITADFGGGSNGVLLGDTDFLAILTQVSATEATLSVSFDGGVGAGFTGMGFYLDPGVTFNGITAGGAQFSESTVNVISVVGDTGISRGLNIFGDISPFLFQNGDSYTASFTNLLGLDVANFSGLFEQGNNTGSFGVAGVSGSTFFDGTAQGFTSASLFDPNNMGVNTVPLPASLGLFLAVLLGFGAWLSFSTWTSVRVGFVVALAGGVEASTGSAFLPDPLQASMIVLVMSLGWLLRSSPPQPALCVKA